MIEELIIQTVPPQKVDQQDVAGIETLLALLLPMQQGGKVSENKEHNLKKNFCKKLRTRK